MFRCRRPADPSPLRRVCPLSSLHRRPLTDRPPVLIQPVIIAKVRKHGSGGCWSIVGHGHHESQAICLPSMSCMHLRSDSIWRAASSPLNKNLDRWRKVDLVSTPSTWDTSRSWIHSALPSSRRLATHRALPSLSSPSSFMQPQRAPCFAHASMSRVSQCRQGPPVSNLPLPCVLLFVSLHKP